MVKISARGSILENLAQTGRVSLSSVQTLDERDHHAEVAMFRENLRLSFPPNIPTILWAFPTGRI